MAPARAATGTAGHHTRPHPVINQTRRHAHDHHATAAASNGGTDATTTEATGQKEKPFGMAVVREAETYHTFSVVHDAVSEADKLCAAVYHAVTGAYFKDIRKDQADGTGLTAVQTAESPPMQAKIREALNCLQAAQTYVRQLLVSTYEPPF